MHSQAIARERSCKAAEVFSVTLVAELEVILSALDLFRLTESQNWADAFRHADASHARALCELEKILKEAHANEVALLNSAMQEQQRLKDEALSRVQQLLEGEACTSDSVKKFLTDLRAKDLELANSAHSSIKRITKSNLFSIRKRRRQNCSPPNTLCSSNPRMRNT